MRLDAIELKNFRCFEQLKITLHPELTVLIAENGMGKTTILDAARIALWPYVKGFDLGSQTGKSATIQIDDVRLEPKVEGNMEPQLPSSITATGYVYSRDRRDFETDEVSWQQRRERVKPGTNTLADDETKKLTELAKFMESDARASTPNNPVYSLPLISYLGTGRLWYQSRYTSEASDVTLKKSEYSRLSGYLNCLTQSSNFKQFVDWYGWVYRSYREAQILAIEKGIELDESGNFFAQAIHVVKSSVNYLITEMTGWRDIAYSAQYHQQLVLQHPEQGILPLEMLSDGLRNMVAMVADLAFRAFKLNPHLGREAAKQTRGIVLIDEVDMFLHPKWQQTVLASLRQAFPYIQFIVTTHSPQVISTIQRDNIRIIKRNDFSTTALPPPEETVGVESQVVLNKVFETNPVPPVEAAIWLNDYIAKIENGSYPDDEGQALRQKLLTLYGQNHSIILDIDRLIRFQEFKFKKQTMRKE